MIGTAYLVANASIIPVWALMIFAPNASVTQKMAGSPAVPAAYALLYAPLLFGSMAMGGSGDMLSLDGLRSLFENDWLLFAAWVHYLCFDMVVGMWVFRDGGDRGIHRGWIGVCLLLTMIYGPVGFLTYIVSRRLLVGGSGWQLVAQD